MRIKILVCLLLCALPVFAQTAREDLWVAPTVETNMYSRSSAAFGGGAALGYGEGLAFGVKIVYYNDGNDLKTLELNLLLRLYVFSADKASGLFVQASAGPVLFWENNNNIAGSGAGSISAGVNVGWRFLLGDSFFIEPAVHAGYPYIAGAGLSAGMRF